MTLVRTILAAAIACGMALTAAPATAADCYAIGQRVAAQNGGTLAYNANAALTPLNQIVVLVPGKNGERPRRTEITVPQN